MWHILFIQCFMMELPYKYNINSCNVFCSWISWEALVLCNLKWVEWGKGKKGAVPGWQWAGCCGSEHIPHSCCLHCLPHLVWTLAAVWLWEISQKCPHPAVEYSSQSFQGAFQKCCNLLFSLKAISSLCLSICSPISSLAPRTGWWWHQIQ